MARKQTPRKVKNVKTKLRKNTDGSEYWSAEIRVAGTKAVYLKEKDFNSVAEMMNEAEHIANDLRLQKGKSPIPLAQTKHSLNEIMGIMQSKDNFKKIDIAEGNYFDEQYSDLAFGTMRKQRYLYNNYIMPLYGDSYIEDITEYHIEKSLRGATAYLAQRQLSTLVSVWKKIFKVAEKQKWIDRRDNPMLSIDAEDIPRSDKFEADKRRKGTLKERRTVDDHELDLLIQEIKKPKSKHPSKFNSYNREVIAFVLILERSLGLRPAEAFAIKKTNITFNEDKNGEITGGVLGIREAIHRTKNSEITLRSTKTESSIRDIPLTVGTAKLIKNMIEKGKERVINPDSPPLYDDWKDYICTRYDGKFFDTGKVGNIISDCCKTLDITFNMYSNRHQVSTDLVVKTKTDEKTAQAIMGHKNFEMTTSYAETNEESMREAIEAISKKD